MKNAKKFGMIAGISRWVSVSVHAAAARPIRPRKKAPDAAEMTAAAIDQAAPAPVENAPDGAKPADGEKPAAE